MRQNILYRRLTVGAVALAMAASATLSYGQIDAAPLPAADDSAAVVQPSTQPAAQLQAQPGTEMQPSDEVQRPVGEPVHGAHALADDSTQPVIPTTQPDSAVNGVTRQNGGMLLNFRDASIDVVLDELSAAAGYIVVKEVKPVGRVSLVSKQPINAEEAVTLLNTVLYKAGFSAIRQGRILKVVASDTAKRMNIPVFSGSDPVKIAQTDELITQVIPLRYANAMQLKTDLQPLINPKADFTSNESSNALVITDTSANVRRIVEIIAALDTSLADSVTVRVYALKYASATNAAQLINNVFGNISIGTANAGNEAQQQPAGPRAWAARMRQQTQQPTKNDVRGTKVVASADERTNSVVVSGSEDALVTVTHVLKELDSNPVADQTVFVYRLRNGQALNLESVVNNIFGNTTVSRSGGTGTQNTLNTALGSSRLGSSSSSRSSRSSIGGASGSRLGQTSSAQTGAFGAQRTGSFAQSRLSSGAQQAAGDLAGQVTVIADTDTNSLLVRTSPQNYEKVKNVLDELDRPVAQVLIKVLIAEVTHDNSDDIGTELSVLNLRANGNGQQGGTNFNIPTNGSQATGLVVQVLENNVSAAIRALESQGKLDVLSRPYILASDNQLASITVGQEIPFVTNSRITDTGGIVNTTEYGDIGILLDVIPHINPDGLVILDVAPEISALSGSNVQINEFVSQPIIAKRSAQSRVGVRNGQTIVIGGLMEDRNTVTLDKVPILGDIPLLGLLFQRHQSTKTKTELLIFLTPHVASDPDMLQKMGEEEKEGVKLVPNAVEPGMFDEHLKGLQRGRTAPPPTTQPDDESSSEP